MSPASLIRLAGQQSISSLKLSEWRALIIALILAISIASLMAVLGERIERTLMRQGSAILGADLVLSNSRPLSPEPITRAAELNLDVTEVTQLGTMANSGENFLLVTIRALNAPYPRGSIALEPETSATLPAPGEAWAEPGVFERLNLQPGDLLTLGKKQFRLSHVIQSAPDRGRGFISFNPQLIINQQDLDSTGLLGPGARLRYRQLFAGDPQAIRQLQSELQQTLDNSARLTSLESEDSQQSSALRKASSYLRLGSLFALLISAMTIFLSLRRYTQSQNKRAALLKSLGLSNRHLLQLYLLQFALAWLACSALALVLTVTLEATAMTLLANLLPQPVPAASLLTYISGPALGLAILFCLGLPALFRLQQSQPMQLLQDQKTALNWGSQLPYLLALLLLLLCASLYLGNILLTLSLTLCLLLIGGGLGWLGAKLAGKIAARGFRHHPLGALLQSRIHQQQRWYRIQIPVICLLFALLSINLVALNDLLGRWQNQLPADTPNHFLINIQEWEKTEVENLLQSYQVSSPLWPIYRGRLSKVNDQPLADVLSPEQLAQPSLKRELNLTSATQIPAHNKLIAGEWRDSNSVSIEQKEAAELGLKLGDKVSFDIAGREVSATITSIRSLRWDSFQPNFYFIFSPGVLDAFSASYMTSFYLDEQSAEVSRRLISEFPTLTLIDVRQLLDQLQQLLSRLSLLSSLLMLLTTAAGVILLYVTLTQELEQRRYENALLQALGASAQQCRQLDRLEMGLIGAISGFLAALISELSLWPIHQLLLQLEPVLHPWLWFCLPLISSLLFIVISTLSHRQQNLARSYQTLVAH